MKSCVVGSDTDILTQQKDSKLRETEEGVCEEEDDVHHDPHSVFICDPGNTFLLEIETPHTDTRAHTHTDPTLFFSVQFMV